MEPEKVSVIIPVYKVEQYLDRCVESVLHQSYTNLEILLVDDGSPDRCGTMCDEWVKNDPRIRVIHKENGGLSDARNTGIDAATGAYVTFVDSDDYIATDMLRHLMEAVIANGADMGICNVSLVDDEGQDLSPEGRPLPIKNEVLTGMDVICRLHEPGGWGYHIACGKLYRKDLFAEIRFPKGRFCEDVSVSHQILGQCGRVACIRAFDYYYVQRTGSIMHNRNRLYAVHEASAYLDRAIYCHDHGLNRCAGSAYWTAAMSLSKAGGPGAAGDGFQDEIRETLRRFRQNSVLGKFCGPKERLQILLVSTSPRLYYLLFRNSARQNIKTRLAEFHGNAHRI